MRPGALDRRSTGIKATVFILSIRRWSAPLHRGRLRVDGRNTSAGHSRRAVAAASCTSSSGGFKTCNEPQTKVWDADDISEEAVGRGIRRLRRLQKKREQKADG